MSSNLPLVCQSCRGRGRCKLEINIPPQQIHTNSKGGLINEEGAMSSEYGTMSWYMYKHGLSTVVSNHWTGLWTGLLDWTDGLDY